MQIEAISNGLGGPSMLMLWLACQGKLPPRISITADTGSENDRLTNKGERVSAKEFFANVVAPLSKKHGIDARFVRSKDEHGNDLPTLWEDVKAAAAAAAAQDVPLYGSNGGQLKQSCTDKWKMRAIRQEARSMGATMLVSAIGLHVNEVMRRARGRIIMPFYHWHERFNLFQHGNNENGVFVPVKWMRHYYPLADMRLSRDIINEMLEACGIPYLLTSECDHCPHKDGARWLRTSPAMIDEIAAKEAEYGGQFFFTDRRIPLKQAMEQFREEAAQPSLYDDAADFGCQSGGYCGV